MIVPFTVTDRFKELCPIDPKDYGPAYDGTSVGLDLYSMKTWTILPNDHFTLIPTGVKVALPRNTQGLILERGSIRKTPLKVRAGVIDPDYTGEIFINCVNLSSEPWKISEGEKLPFQLVCTPVLPTKFITEKEYQALTENSLRQDACLGSSN